MSRLRALLATLRIANAPSVVSNVWLGYMMGDLLWGDMIFGFLEGAEFPWHRPVLLSLAGILLYFSGNLANDWFDRAWDKERRPERALPSGLFPPTAYLVSSWVLAGSGSAIAFLVEPACGACVLAIVALIAIYTRYHKQAIWSVLPMGLCRAGLYFLGAFAFWSEMPVFHPFANSASAFNTLKQLAILLTLATGLVSYIAGLSLSARYEGMDDAPQGPRVISKALLILPLLAMSCWFMGISPLLGVIGMLPLALWLALCFTRFRRPIPRYVSALLAGIPLVDFIAACPVALAIPFGLFGARPAIFAFPHLMALLLIPLIAFVLGRLLQKVAPAT
jgi:4-hydroxybenzoate polyprenyltransferase